MKTEINTHIFKKSIALAALWIFLFSNASFALRPQSADDRLGLFGETPAEVLDRLIGEVARYQGSAEQFYEIKDINARWVTELYGVLRDSELGGDRSISQMMTTHDISSMPQKFRQVYIHRDIESIQVDRYLGDLAEVLRYVQQRISSGSSSSSPAPVGAAAPTPRPMVLKDASAAASTIEDIKNVLAALERRITQGRDSLAYRTVGDISYMHWEWRSGTWDPLLGKLKTQGVNIEPRVVETANRIFDGIKKDTVKMYAIDKTEKREGRRGRRRAARNNDEWRRNRYTYAVDRTPREQELIENLSALFDELRQLISSVVTDIDKASPGLTITIAASGAVQASDVSPVSVNRLQAMSELSFEIRNVLLVGMAEPDRIDNVKRKALVIKSSYTAWYALWQQALQYVEGSVNIERIPHDPAEIPALTKEGALDAKECGGLQIDFIRLKGAMEKTQAALIKAIEAGKTQKPTLAALLGAILRPVAMKDRTQSVKNGTVISAEQMMSRPSMKGMDYQIIEQVMENSGVQRELSRLATDEIDEDAARKNLEALIKMRGIRAKGIAEKITAELLAIIAERKQRRLAAAQLAAPFWESDIEVPLAGLPAIRGLRAELMALMQERQEAGLTEAAKDRLEQEIGRAAIRLRKAILKYMRTGMRREDDIIEIVYWACNKDVSFFDIPIIGWADARRFFESQAGLGSRLAATYRDELERLHPAPVQTPALLGAI